jgi:hypothetical protein
MSMELAAPVRRTRAVVVLVIAIVAISAAAWTILSPAGAVPRPAGVPGYEVVAGTPFTVSPGNNVAVDVACPSGKKPLGGGASNEADSLSESFAVLTASAPTVNGTGWHVRVKNEVPTGIGDITVNPYAVCATA